MLGEFFIQKLRNKNRKNKKQQNIPFTIPIEIIEKQCSVMKQISEENKKLKSKLNFITASIEKNMMKKKTRQMKNSKIILRKYRNTNYEKNIEENREERRNQIGVNQLMLKRKRKRQLTSGNRNSICFHSQTDRFSAMRIVLRNDNNKFKEEEEGLFI